VTFLEPSDMLQGSPLPGWEGRFFHSANMTFAHWDIADGAADLHEHHHEQEEVWNVVAGEIVLAVDGVEHTLRDGDAVVVPSDTPHAARPRGAARVIVADYPLRPNLPGIGSRS
jgi:mannose-6-phosphate isomerase-like protein (cupin superfamily)